MIFSFSALGRHGRLGNQLFQIASTLGLAEKYGATAAFPDWEYEQFFETPIPHGERQAPRIAERYFHHYDWELTGSCDLYGYMQSEKYFGSTRLKLKESYVEDIKSYYDIFQRETICIQIRRGDYVGNENYHQLTPNYYIDALLTNFPNWKECNLLFISDDIEYCRTHFECLPNATFSMGSDIQDLALASACDHHIISNSSFGWWSAWLGEKKHSKIVHCGKLHAGDLKSSDIQDYYPERWTVHQKKDYKIPLKDVTFTIPVLYDHKDRKDNFDLSLFILQNAFDTNFIVCEQGGDHFAYAAQWGKYLQSDSKHFHRTYMLNEMCNEADTQFIVNWDCDVIIPPVQILMAVEKLREGADMVFPYDGRFARMRRQEWMPQLHGNPDIGIVGNTMFKGREPEHLSVGGAVMFNRDAFMDGGMENENMISFGPEDNERVERFRKLNYDMQRVGGTLFHMSHHVGPNSSPENPYWPANNMEFEKVKAMDAGALREYVSTWEWVNQYSSRYYGEISEGAIRSAKIVMKELFFLGIHPDSVIDVGCGVGEWNNGHPDYIGVDRGILKKNLLIEPERYIECDLNREIVPAVRKYDLCLCLEVAEHLRPHRAGFLVEMLCNLSDRVLFSAGIPFQGGNGHINEQWQSYWAEIFKQHGFGPTYSQPNIRQNPDVELWYRQNMVLYQRGMTGKVIDFVLPEYYMKIAGYLHGRLHEKR